MDIDNKYWTVIEITNWPNPQFILVGIYSNYHLALYHKFIKSNRIILGDVFLDTTVHY